MSSREDVSQIDTQRTNDEEGKTKKVIDYLCALRDFNTEAGQTNINSQTVRKCVGHKVFGIKLHQINVN